MKFRRFTNRAFLHQVGRKQLGKLFARFTPDLEARQVRIPPPDLDDTSYFSEVSGLVMKPDALPDNLIETLFAIEEMANPEGQERIEKAATQLGLDLKFDEASSHGDIAVQAFLAMPELLVEKHNEQRLIRLTTFEYFGSKRPVNRSESEPDGPAFATPSQSVLDRITADLDSWFKEHNRGEQTAQIEVYCMEREFWFLVRHGDTYARTPKVEGRTTEILHFRPAKDDVVVYSPERDEIRIHAATKGEKELYRTVFGLRLMGDHDYFSERKAYTLEPLREMGADALDVSDIDGLRQIVLREYEVEFRNGYKETLIRKAKDIYAAAAARNVQAIPQWGNLVRATFDFYFDRMKKPRKVTVRPPNALKLGRHCDAHLVHRWLSARGFRASERMIEILHGGHDGDQIVAST